jgi:hypothetical protein
MLRDSNGASNSSPLFDALSKSNPVLQPAKAARFAHFAEHIEKPNTQGDGSRLVSLISSRGLAGLV